MLCGTTDCALRYAVRRNPGAQAAFVSLSIRCGSRGEYFPVTTPVRSQALSFKRQFPEGTAHFLEHTLFKGTSGKSARRINSRLDALGGELNAYTTKEEIVLHATVLKEDLEKAVDLLMEIAADAIFPEKELELEKGVVLDEISACRDTPSDDIFDRFEQAFFGSHPLSGLILGTSASLRRITRKDLLAFRLYYFRPENMAFSLVADRDEEASARLIARCAARWWPLQSPRQTCPQPPQAGGQTVRADGWARTEAAGAFTPVLFNKTLHRHGHQANCIIGCAAPSLFDEDRMVAILLCNLLGGPACNSILNAQLREKHGWVYSVECNCIPFSDCGLATIYLGCDKDRVEDCLQLIAAETARLREKPLSPARLRAAQKQLLGQLAVSADNAESRCLSMGRSLLVYGRISPDEEIRQRILSITPEVLRDTACRLFTPDAQSVLIYR